MAKRKLQRFAEMETFNNVIQPAFEDFFQKDFSLKNNWKEEHFKNQNSIVLELGCGKGEYTVGLARRYPEKNFIGIDIKGARMWRGASTAKNDNITNIAFLRTRIEHIGSFFGKDEINEIWITFPDPQLKNQRNKKRLTASKFLNAYKEFLSPGGTIHLKTDNETLYLYTKQIIERNHLQLLFSTDDLYSLQIDNEAASIQTFYENQYLLKGITIKYLKFVLPDPLKVIEEPFEEG
jgi:tRNA (guanine-N7-)-methyltransferase